MDQDQPDVESDVPDNIRHVLENVQFLHHEDMDDDEKEIFSLGEEGKCMCCRGELGPTTTLVVVDRGIAMVFCCGQCLNDMAVIGWVQEQHEDLVSAVKFRGGTVGDEIEDDDG